MDTLYDINEYDDDRNRRSGLWISIFIHLLLLLLFIAPLFNRFPKKNEEFKGVLVVFGDQENGKESNAQIENKEINEVQESDAEWEEETEDAHTKNEEVKEEEKEEPEPIEETITEPPKEATPKEIKDTPAVISKITEKKAEVLAAEEKAAKELEAHAQIEKQKKADLERAEQERLEAQKQKEAAAKAKKEKAEKAAAEKAAAEKAKKEAELAAKKKQYGDLFNNGSGDSDNEGSEGDPIGDPDGSALEGISTGKAEIGGGLSDRGVAYEPSIKDNSQKSGRVVIRVCVDKNGKVIEASFTQKGSNTTDRTLVEIAEKAAAKYTFTANDIDKQCGTIAIDFKLK